MASLPDPLSILSRAPVIPVLTIERAEDAVPLARALVAGALPVLEVTLRTAAALDAISAIARDVPDAIVGAGTITKLSDVDDAARAGARYLVSPGTPRPLAHVLARAGVPIVPGCSTVSEAMTLADEGFAVLKFFPAESSGGIGWLKAVAAPLPHLRFCPTGGIDAKNAGAYLALPNVTSVGGSWPAPKDVLAARDWSRIETLAREAATLRAGTRA